MLVWKEALLFLIALIVVIRPASVFISTLGLKNVTFKEKVFLSMMAPRGIVAAAVSSVFALDLAEHTDYADEAARIVPVVYAVIVGTVAFYGLLAGIVARKLGLATKNPQGILFIGIKKWSIEAAVAIQDAGFRVLMMDTNYGATADARMAGVPAVNANVLSDFAAEELDLVGIGSMVAATVNDQVNTLACVSLGHTLGISHVFQVKPEDVEESERKSSSTEYNGRPIGNTSLTAAEFEKRKNSGAVVKRTSLNEEFTLESFEELYGDSATILFRITSSGGLTVVTPESTAPSSGDQLISLVIEPEVKAADEPAVATQPESKGPAKLP